MIDWVKATETPPPFGKRILVVFGAFADDPARQRGLAVCTIVKDSPNDEEPGERTEYAAYRNGEADFGDFQFYLVPSVNEYAMPINVGLHGEDLFMDTFSDSISHWTQIALPAHDA